MATAAGVEAIEQLAARVHGDVLIPDNPAYAAARRTFNGMIDRAMAYSQRDKRYNISGLAIWEEDGTPQRHIQWSRDLTARIEPLSGGGAAYVNYLDRDASPGEVRQAYGGEKYERLRAIKTKYDPGNLFRFNQNIPPA